MQREGLPRHTPSAEEQYLDWAERIIDEGESDDDRTGIGTIELFGEPQMTYDLREEFPLLTSKFVATKAIKGELAWMLRGRTDLRYLLEHDTHIWDEWPFVGYLRDTNQPIPEQGADEWKTAMAAYRERVLHDDEFAAAHGMLGPVYGYQWRAWPGLQQLYPGSNLSGAVHVDQLRDVQEQIRHIDETNYKKYGRRLIVSAWNVTQIEEMSANGLPPCHMMYQFNASDKADPETGQKYLDLKMYQRSADWFLGVPFNMAQYAMLLSAMAHTTDRTPRFMYHTFGSAHIYSNHILQVEQQLSRRDDLYPAPQLVLNPDVKDIGDFEPEDLQIINYRHHPTIKGQVAI